MAKNRVRSLVLCGLSILVICFLSTTFFPDKAHAQPKTLKIGVINSMTGPMAPAFKSMIEAAKPAADLINQRGGVTVKGQKYLVEVLTTDDQSTPPGAVAATNKLLQSDVKFVVSPLFMPNFMATGNISEEAKVLRVNPSCVDPMIFGPPNKYSFDADATSLGVPYMYDKIKSIFPNIKRVAIIHSDDPGMKYVVDQVQKEIKKRGMEVVAHEAFKVTTDDFYPILTKVLAQKPDSIELITGIVPWPKAIIEQGRELGFTGPITSVAPPGDPKAAVNPKYAYDVLVAVHDVASPKMPQMVKDFAKLVEKVSKDPMDFTHVLMLESLFIITQGIEKAQSFDTEKVTAALENMPKIETPYGPGKFIGKGLIGSDRLLSKSIPFTRFMKGGKMEFEFLPVKH